MLNAKFLQTAGAAVKGLFGKQLLTLSKHSPEILLAGGIGCIVGGVICACRATLKVSDVLDEHKAKVAKINQDKEISEDEEYTDEAYKKDLTVAHAQTAVSFVKLYALPAGLTIGGIAFIVSGHKILNGRLIGVTAAYKALSEGFEQYRKRVIEEHGAEKDYMYKNGLREEEETVLTYDEHGNQKAETRKIMKREPGAASIYSRFFGPDCRAWSKDAEYNKMYLVSQERFMNDLLAKQGYLFLNDVYATLGMEKSDAGGNVGWITGGNGDNFVSFGIDKEYRFINGTENTPLLDFNVDGIILGMVDEINRRKRLERR